MWHKVEFVHLGKNVPDFPLMFGAMFYALVFAVHDYGYVARCALEVDDSGLSVFRQFANDCEAT